MPIFTIIAIVVFAGYAIYTRVYSSPARNPGTSSGTVLSQDSTQSSPSPSAVATFSPTALPKPTSKSVAATGTSKIDIKVDSEIDNTTPTSEKIVYHGATNIAGNHFEADTDPDTVYNWYKGELEKRSFKIRNNIKTRANEKFKAILQGVSGSSSLKVTIEQENGSQKTQIFLE